MLNKYSLNQTRLSKSLKVKYITHNEKKRFIKFKTVCLRESMNNALNSTWNMRNLHHSLSFTIRQTSTSCLWNPSIICKADSVLSHLFHSGPFIHQELTAQSVTTWRDRNPSQLVSLSGHRAIHGNCKFKVPISVRWESEQNGRLPISPWEYYLEQKAWLSGHWQKTKWADGIF